MQPNLVLVPGKVLYPDTPPGRDAYGAWFINITDDNGNPVNGDNIIVAYAENTGGVSGVIQYATIPGQSYKIYEGIIQHNAEPPKSYILTGTSTPGTPSPPIIPDTAIQSVDIIQKADSAGLNGTVMINATTSYGPIAYYIDDVLGTANRSGITAGPHTAKVIDANDNEVEIAFTMVSVDSILTKDPSLTVGEKTSRWNAVFNPIVFEYARRDFEVTAISQDDTTQKAKFVVNTNLAGVVVGDLVLIDAGITNGLSTYKGALKVLSIALPSTLVLDADYIEPDTVSGFVNIDRLRPYYKVITNIKFVDPATGRFKTIVSTNRPINGVTKANISSLLQSIVKPGPDLSDYTAINYRDMGLAASYQISYAETWEGNTPEYTDIETPYYCVYSAKQIQEYGGGNLFKQVPAPGATPAAKWLTDFVEPSYTTGFPFDLPFIYSEIMAGYDIYYKITLLDINRQPLPDDAITGFLLNEDSSYILNNDGSKLIIAKQQLVNTPIVERVGLNRLLIDTDFGDTCCYLQVQLFYDDAITGNPVQVTEAITVRVDKTCTINPVYLRWIGLNGSWNYFRFNYNQTLTLDIQNPTIIKDYVDDWENAEGIERVISKDASEKVQVYADALDKNDMAGLKSIKFSPYVQVMTQRNPLKWQTIIVNSSTFTEGETINEQSEFGITYNLPSRNVQSQ